MKERSIAVAAAGAALFASLACSSGQQVQSSGIPGFEPTVKVSQVGTETYFAIDSNDVVVISGDQSLLAPGFILIDDAQRAFRRYFQRLPQRTAVAIITEARDSAAIDSLARAAKAPLVVWENVTPPRDRRGQALPLSRFTLWSIVNSVARAWVMTDTTGGSGRLPDWVLIGITQLVSGFPTSQLRASQLSLQAENLIPLDSLTRMTIPATAIPTGVVSEAGAQGPIERPSAGRTTQTAVRRLPPRSIAALQAASVVEFMWAREGRDVIRELVALTRRGEPLSAVLARTRSLPHDVPSFEAQWRLTIKK